jgi:Cu(I)/Ag(I) efflux system membrane protein CusA/SilA
VPSGWVYVDVRDRDLGSAVRDMRRAVAASVALPPGYSVSWSGQFEYLERATARLRVVVPFTLAIILVLLYLTFRRFDEALLVMATLPFALVGGIWLLYFLGYNLSVATAVGFIALAGVAAEFGVIMLLHLRQAWAAEVMRRIAAPMVGGMITAPLLSMLVIPAAYVLMRRRETRGSARARLPEIEPSAIA